MERKPEDRILPKAELNETPALRAVLRGLWASVKAKQEGNPGWSEEEARLRAAEYLGVIDERENTGL